MPVNTGSDNEGCFARWGTQGAKYRYPCGDEAARKEAKSKAYKQGLATGEYANVTLSSTKTIYERLSEFYSIKTT